MQSGVRSFPSNERRSALERLFASKDRVPLLLDGEANANSGRLQGISVQQGDDMRQHHSSSGSSRHPSSKAAGKAHVDQSPIRTLSEDRRHVSLRLGPMLDSEETILEDIPLPRRIGEASHAGRKAQGKKKMNIPSSSRKRAGRSPPQGVSVKRRRTTKSQTSSKRRHIPATAAEVNSEAGTSRAARPKANPATAATRRGADFWIAPNSLP